jgi:tetratricopeptide (TPR) repeat protein
VAANNLAYTDAVIGRAELMPEADKYSEEALQILSWTPFTKGTRGTVLLELGRPAEAIPYLLEAMQENDVPLNKAQSACWLAIAEARQGNLNSAQKYLEQARKFDPTCFLLERALKALAT